MYFDPASLCRAIEEEEGISLEITKKAIPVWNTLGRPTGVKGLIGGNTTTDKIEWYDGTQWLNADGTSV